MSKQDVEKPNYCVLVEQIFLGNSICRDYVFIGSLQCKREGKWAKGKTENKHKKD